MNENVRIAIVGDMILDVEGPDRLFNEAREALAEADLVVGNLEVPHSLRGAESEFDIPAPKADPKLLKVLGGAGFTAMTLASNHVFDLGREGIEDTVEALHQQGILAAGAGMNLEEARRPAIIERSGVRVGLLNYNCVGPKQSRASSRKPGAAYVDIITHYELNGANPGGPPDIIHSFPDPASQRAMLADVAALRKTVDIVIVALHKGLIHTPAMLAMYEQILTNSIVDAGADIVVGHHAHICRGIEVYRGTPVYHGLGNFITLTSALAIHQENAIRSAWAEKRRKLFGFEPDPAMPLYPFHPESRNTLVAVCDVDCEGVIRAGFLPCWINDAGAPEVHGRDDVGERVARYFAEIGKRAGLFASFEWDGEQLTFWRRSL